MARPPTARYDGYYKPDAAGLKGRADARLRTLGARDREMRRRWGARGAARGQPKL